MLSVNLQNFFYVVAEALGVISSMKRPRDLTKKGEKGKSRNKLRRIIAI